MTETTGASSGTVQDHTCPRCHHQIPNDRYPGEYQGALSRTDGKTMVCAACGNDEGVKQRSGILEDPSEWPVVVDQAWYDLSMGIIATPPPMQTPTEQP